MPQTSLIQAYNNTLQYAIPRRCMYFTITSLMYRYPTHPHWQGKNYMLLAMVHRILSLHIKSTSNHLNTHLYKNRAVSAYLGEIS